MPMPTSKLKAAEAKKLEAERLQCFLHELLREEENKYCADCEQKQPRWASWNLGVFLCIRCAGLHRNLGVHISKVKSVTLDSWTPEQVQSMRVMGNAKARAVYENELPPLFRRPQTDQSLEQFIRAKYETKRYIMKGWVPVRVDANDLPAFPDSMARDKKVAALLTCTQEKRQNVIPNPGADKKSQQASPPTKEKSAPTLIDFDFSAHVSQNQNSEQKDLASMDDLFGPIVSAGPPQQHSLMEPSGVPASHSTPNLSNIANSNNLLSTIFSTTEPQSQLQHQTIRPPPNTTTAAPPSSTANPQAQPSSDLIGSDLFGLDLTMCSIGAASSGNQVTALQNPQSNSTMLSSAPQATDTKKSTNEILALFNK